MRDTVSGFLRDPKGAAAVEFALVSSPFILLLLGLLQLGIYFTTQSSLDGGVVLVAETLRNSFTTASPVLLNAAALKASIVASSGGLIHNDSTSAVEIRPLIALDSAAVPIVDGTVDYGTTTSVLVLRAQSQVFTFAPGFSTWVVQSAAIVRRQGT